MKSTELRIGNLVYFDRKIEEVDIVDFQVLKGYINNITKELYRPIPLTEEWLLKLGFKKWGKNTFYLGAIKIHHRKRGFVIAKRYQDIIYVHTLQNIVQSLTGKII